MRSSAIDFYKFFLSLVIILLHSNWEYIPQGYLAVESFFIISGFFLYLSYNSIKQKDSIEFLISRIQNIYPIYVSVLILHCIILYFLYKSNFLIKQLPLYIFGVQLLTIKEDGNNFIGNVCYLWFVPVLIFSCLLFFYIFKKVKREEIFPIAVLSFFISFSLIVYISPPGGLNYSFERFIQFIPFGYIRGIFGISLGIITGSILEYVKDIYWLQNKMIITIVEIAMLFSQAIIMLMPVTPYYDYSYMFAAAISIILLYLNKGYMSKIITFICRYKIVSKLSTLSLALYLFHPIVIILYKHYFEIEKIVGLKHICVIYLFTFVCAYLLDKLNRHMELRKYKSMSHY